MENKTLIGSGIGAILMLIASFTYVNIVYMNGVELQPNHYCLDRGIKSYCSEVTPYYSLPNGKCINPKGNLLCKSGWEEIVIGTEKPQLITCQAGGNCK